MPRHIGVCAQELSGVLAEPFGFDSLWALYASFRGSLIPEVCCLHGTASTATDINLITFSPPHANVSRYGLFESIRIWYSHPNHRGLLQSDLFVCSMLTLITFSLIMIIVFGLQYFAMQSKEMGLPKLWTESSLIIFLTIVVSIAFTDRCTTPGSRFPISSSLTVVPRHCSLIVRDVGTGSLDCQIGWTLVQSKPN